MLLNGSEILIECLKEQGVDTIFGYPGGAILNVYDELYKHPEIRHILTSHEQGASHAADGYARATGKVGVCFATSGPGATNLVTGIATAMMDSVPIVAVTCNVGVAALGKDSFQEIDILGITMPITKHNFIVKNVDDLADTIRRAFRIARTGRPGPVLVDIPKDVTAAKTEYRMEIPQPIVPNRATIREKDVRDAVDLINASERPFIMLGGGAVISGATDVIAEFAGMVDAPVCDTLMGKGAFDGESLNYTGMIGMHGTKASDYGVAQCDLLIAIGCRFSDRVTGNIKSFTEGKKIIHIDIDPAEIGKNVPVDVSIIGDVKDVLNVLLSRLKPQNHQAWLKKIFDLKESYP
ncbi:MAG: thiamine pyrophosphate-binding protein, partial [Lachnospiraceae bacterium]